MSTAAEATIRVLQRFHNAILEGPPGTGKTFVVAEIASRWQAVTQRPLGGNGNGAYAITFHPSTTYEEFIEGLRYDDTAGDEGFKRRDGFLLKIVEKAESDPGRDYLILLDEINRANVPKVLGDVLLCMESSKRSQNIPRTTDWRGGSEVTLPYSGRVFSMPSNIYLLGTMNTSDRSIAPLDSALRRRFGFVRADPLAGEALHDAIRVTDGDPAADRMARSVDELTNLNAALRETLGPDAMLGHSYLFGAQATSGATGSTPDPLRTLRELVENVSAIGAIWLEVASTSGGSENQLDIPDQSGARPGLRTEFYPMASGGTETATPSAQGAQDALDIHFGNEVFVRNTLEYNNGGSNYRFKYQGRTAGGAGINDRVGRGGLAQKVHVFVRRPDFTYDLLLFDRDPAIVAALKAVSVAPSGWTARTMPGATGRDYGVIDLDELASTGASTRTADEDAEWMIWRYAILPQLVDTVTQLGVSDLLDPATREAALTHLGKESVADRFATFDQFLAGLSLYLGLQGHGLSRGVAILETSLLPETFLDAGVDDTESSDEDELDGAQDGV